MFNCLQHWFFQPLFFFPINNILCFPWLSILEHMFLNCLISCCNINIHHIHIYTDCFYLSNRLNFCYCHRFSMKHLLHLNKLWTVYHFMSIQTTNVACIWRCLLWFLTLLCYLCGYHYGLFLFLFTRLHIVNIHSTICSILVSLPCILLNVFGGAAYLVLCGTENAFLTPTIVIFSSHNIPTSLCCYSVDRFMLVVTILRYDYKSTLNIIIKT